MTILHSLILGIVEGVTEFLPISSTGHLILASELLKIPSTDFLKSFIIIIQFGTIASVLVLYWRDFLRWATLKKIIAGSVPTAIIGFGFYKIIKNNLLGSDHVVLWALLVGGILLVVFELFYRGPDVAEENIAQISYKQAFTIGVFQSLAIIPGVSRSAATIIGGLSLGIPRRTIVKFSFLLAAPVLFGASLLDAVNSPEIFASGNLRTLAIGFVVAFLVGIAAIRFFMNYIKTKNFIPFGVYRIIISIAFFLLIL